MFSKKNFQVGQTVYCLVHRVFGRKVNEYIAKCEVVKIGNKYLTVKDTNRNSSYQFDIQQNFLYYDPIYGTNSDIELFLTEQDILDLQHAEKLYDEIEAYFHDFTFRASYAPNHIPPWKNGSRINLDQLILIDQILDPSTGKALAKSILAQLSNKKESETE